MKSTIKLVSVLMTAVCTLIFTESIFSQADSDDSLTIQLRTAIIEKIVYLFKDYYPIPEVSEKMINYIKKRETSGEYEHFKNIEEFTIQLTKDLRSQSNDDHIRVYPYEVIPDDLLSEIKLGTPENNYGFQKVEILPGNFGYINLTTFNNPKTAGSTAVAAMNFVSNCNALIIDLRFNGGGDESMSQFLSSYFFEKSTHLTDIIIPKDSIMEQKWTQEWVPGPRITEAPIYILMSKYSYSSSEVLAYQLQQIGRAIIVGETTRGGVHSVKFMSFPELLINIKIPYTTEINPYSKTNYINGVIPDIKTSSMNALIVSKLEAAKKLLESETNSEKRYTLEWMIADCETELNPLIIDDKTLFEYAGTYKNIKIFLECDNLMLQRSTANKQEMIPMGNDLFKYKDVNEYKYRVQFIRSNNGEVTGLYELDFDGDKYPVKEREKK